MTEHPDNEMEVIVPTTALLKAMRNASLSWKVGIGELIDNSLDANATRVSIHFNSKADFSVIDNGDGCSSIQAMLTIGNHHNRSAKLGKYGVGLKDFACWLWCEMRINTRHGRTRREAIISWPSVEKRGEWKFEKPREYPHHGETGTTIRFTGIDDKRLPDMVSIAEEIGYTFYPAIIAGRQIELRGIPKKDGTAKSIICRAYKMPPFSESIDCEISVDGKSARVHCGIVQEGHENSRPGFTYTYKHRVIIASSSLGSDGCPTGRIAATVELDGDEWHLSKNKDDISQHKEQLGDEVFRVCRELLEKARQQSIQMTSSALSMAVGDELSAALGAVEPKTAKAKRASRQTASGAIVPAGTGRVHGDAMMKQPGESMSAHTGGKKVGIEPLPMAGGVIGSVEIQTKHITIKVNTNSECVKAILKENNKTAMRILCAALFCEHVVANKLQQQTFAFCDKKSEPPSFYVSLDKLASTLVDVVNKVKPADA